MHLFYSPETTQPFFTLNEEESKHCIRVLRLKAGDEIQLLDGAGGMYTAIIENENPKSCLLKIIDTKSNVGKRNWSLQIAIAPTKNMDRLEWFTEKATELTIDEISLIHCSNSERTIVKTERLKKVTIAAIKQSIKAYLPKINELTDFKKYVLSKKHFEGQKFIAHCNPSSSKQYLKKIYAKGNNTIIMIGPEGDFTAEEINYATKSGFIEISLGESRLRTETAALYGCAIINLAND